MDGNGRTGRMLMNFILMKTNTSSNNTKKESFKFLDALHLADEVFEQKQKRKYLELVNFMVAELNETYWNNFL